MQQELTTGDLDSPQLAYKSLILKGLQQCNPNTKGELNVQKNIFLSGSINGLNDC